VIGINEIGFANLGGAIPGNLAQTVVSKLIKHGEMPGAWTGLTHQTRLVESERGALVAFVAKGSPAKKAGIRAGDLFLSLGGVQTNCGFFEPVPGDAGRPEGTLTTSQTAATAALFLNAVDRIRTTLAQRGSSSLLKDGGLTIDRILQQWGRSCGTRFHDLMCRNPEI
jgi:hypothetical protein